MSADPQASAACPRWRAVGPRGDDGLTHLERKWYAKRFAQGVGAKSTPAEMESLTALPPCPSDRSNCGYCGGMGGMCIRDADGPASIGRPDV